MEILDTFIHTSHSHLDIESQGLRKAQESLGRRECRVLANRLHKKSLYLGSGGLLIGPPLH
jgi:hypothetical protein